MPNTSPAATIFAPATPAGKSALAVIRISGPNARHVFEGIAGRLPQPRLAVLRTLRHPDTRAALDQALALFFAAPATETGEDIVEFQVHGGRAVIAAVLDAIAAVPGCRLAEPGEFARRAFHNGKLDLTAVEGLADLIDAETDAQRAQALTQAAGVLDRLYRGWRTRLIDAQALVEAAIDFADEGDVAADAVAKARAMVATLELEVKEHLGNANRGEIQRSGFKVVLAGAPNAGKSSLLNALARRDVAIVSDEPGTTRDVIQVRLDLEGIPVLVSDTAGIRTATGKVEQEGIRRTVAQAQDADLVLWLEDMTSGTDRAQLEETGRDWSGETLVVRTKADLLSDTAAVIDPGLVVSAVTGAGIDDLIAAIVDRARRDIGSTTDPAPTNARHRQHLGSALAALDAVRVGEQVDLELRAEDLRIAGVELGKLVGRIDPEEVLGAIFGRFCIGK